MEVVAAVGREEEVGVERPQGPHSLPPLASWKPQTSGGFQGALATGSFRVL